MENILLDIQKEKVDELYNTLKQKDTISFQSPTGSGKTMMVAYLINKIKFNNPKAIFFVVSLSTGGIAKQNYEKFLQYTKEYGLNFTTHHIESVSKNNIDKKKDIEYSIPEGYDVYTMGQDSFDSGTLLYSRGYLQSFICEQKKIGKEIYFIRDEAHIGAQIEEKVNKIKQEIWLNDLLDKELTSKKQTVNLSQLYSFFTKKIYLSATLSDKVIVDVEMTNDEAEHEHLVKSKCIYLPTEEEWTDKKVLQKAIDDFKIIKKKYLENFNDYETIHPAILIQIGLSDQGDEQLLWIKKMLEDNNLHWFIWLSKEKQPDTNTILSNSNNALMKKCISENGSPIDVVIFKQAIAVGWDIPRACMLVQFRDIASPDLSIQTIGRVRRNPLLKYGYDNLNVTQQELASTYWLYSIHKSAEKFAFNKVVKKDNFKNLPIKISTTKFDKEVISNPQKRNFINVIKKELSDKLYLLYKNDLLDEKLEQIKKNDGKLEIKEKVENNGRIYETIKLSINNIFQIKNLWNEAFKEEKLISIIDSIVDEFANKKHTTSWAIKASLLSEPYLQTINELKEIWTIQNMKIFPIIKDRDIALAEWSFDKGKSKYQIKIDGKTWDAWVYKHITEQNDKIFLAESNAEKEVLKEMKNYFNYIEKPCEFFTKNFLENSEIKFSYYKRNYSEGLFEDGVWNSNEIGYGKSYPDVLLKYNNKIFIIEIKGEDHGSKTAINDKEYEKKIKSLVIGYEENSKVLNNYVFALILYKNNKYSFYKFENGKRVEMKQQDNLDKLFE